MAFVLTGLVCLCIGAIAMFVIMRLVQDVSCNDSENLALRKVFHDEEGREEYIVVCEDEKSTPHRMSHAEMVQVATAVENQRKEQEKKEAGK